MERSEYDNFYDNFETEMERSEYDNFKTLWNYHIYNHMKKISDSISHPRNFPTKKHTFTLKTLAGLKVNEHLNHRRQLESLIEQHFLPRQLADFILNLHTNEPYHNKAYLETLLNYSTEYKEKVLKTSGWIENPPSVKN